MNLSYIKNIRDCFPILKNKINGKNLVYLDNAAITQVPECVITSFINYYSTMNANIHRGAYYLSEVATENYENVRTNLCKFFNGESEKNFIFVRSTTEGINLVANSYLKQFLKSGDEILISHMEHHSNIVPWYVLAKELNIKIKVIPVLLDGTLDYEKIDVLISERTKLVSVCHVSNSIGTINDLKRIIFLAHQKDVPVLIDGAQSFSHCKINLIDIDCDFYSFSSHKMHGPNGLGFLYSKKKFLDKMIPYQCGGDMIKSVEFDDVVWNDYPYKFEAGTPAIANVIAFGETLKFLSNLDLEKLFLYKKSLFEYTYNKLLSIPYLRFVGNPKYNSSIISFLLDGVHPHDFATIANYYGVAVRTGHHCSMPIMKFFNINASIRVSLSFYNDFNEVDTLISSILEAKKIFL